MPLIPNSNGEDNRPLREFNANHDQRGRFAVRGSASALTDTNASHPMQPIPATSVFRKTAQAAMAVISPNPKGYDMRAVQALLGPRVTTAVKSLIEDKAPLANLELTTMLAKVQQQTGAQMTHTFAELKAALVSPGTAIAHGPIKSMFRTVEKAVSERSGDISQVKDIVRATIVVDKIGQVGDMMKTLRASGITPVGRIDNRFDTPTKEGYRDIKFNVRLPGTNVVGEIQIQVKAMMIAKNGMGHTYYEEKRTLEGAVRTAGRKFTATEKARLAELRQLSRTLYDTAYHAAGGR